MMGRESHGTNTDIHTNLRLVRLVCLLLPVVLPRLRANY